jgi:hypothetical protein
VNAGKLFDHKSTVLEEETDLVGVANDFSLEITSNLAIGNLGTVQQNGVIRQASSGFQQFVRSGVINDDSGR